MHRLRVKLIFAALTLSARILLGLVAASSPGWAIDPNVPLRELVHQTWGKQEGLPPGTIFDIKQTTDGYLWLGTDDGLSRFDGVRFNSFNHYNLPALGGSSVRTLLPARNGDLWVGLKDGLVRFRGNRAERIPGSVEMNVSGIAEDQSGTVWAVVPNSGLYRLEAGQMSLFRRFQSSTGLASITVDRQDRLWIGGFNGLYRLDPPARTPIQIPELNELLIISLIPDHTSGIWFATQRHGIGHVADTGSSRFDVTQGTPAVVRNLVQDRDGTIWISGVDTIYCLRHGVVIGSLSSSGVPLIFLDRDGVLWAGGDRGLHRYKEGLFSGHPVPEDSGPNSSTVWSVLATGPGTAWIGSDVQGLYQFTNGHIISRSQWKAQIHSAIFRLARDSSGTVWAATPEGVFSIDRSEIVHQATRTRSSTLLPDENDRVYFGCPHGVCLLDHGRESLAIPLQAFGEPRVYDIAKSPDGTIWIGASSIGLLAYRNGKLERVWSGPPARSVFSIYQDKAGTLWLGTEGGGLLRYKHGKFALVNRSTGLPSDQIGSIIEDAYGCLWMASNVGAIRVNKASLEQVMDRGSALLPSLIYTTSDGLPSDDLSICPSALSWSPQDRRMWLAGVRGVALSQSGFKDADQPAPDPTIETISVDGVDSDLRTIPPGTRRIEIRYSAPALIAAEKVRFRYRLTGFDPEWLDASTRRSVSYTNLSPGTYQFEVMSINASQKPSARVASLLFRVEPFFYQTDWFYSLLALAALLLVFLAFQIRLRAMEVRFSAVLEERTRMSRELHDTVLQGLLGSIYELQGIRARISSLDDSLGKQISRLVASMARSARDARRSLSELRSSALAKGDLAAAINELATNGSPVVVERRIEGTPYRIPEMLAHDLYRVAQEAVTNAIRHSGAPKVVVSLSYAPRSVTLEVRDSGAGFDLAAFDQHHNDHYGLQAIRERAERMHASLVITSAPGSGTHIRLIVPIRMSMRFRYFSR